MYVCTMYVCPNRIHRNRYARPQSASAANFKNMLSESVRDHSTKECTFTPQVLHGMSCPFIHIYMDTYIHILTNFSLLNACMTQVFTVYVLTYILLYPETSLENSIKVCILTYIHTVYIRTISKCIINGLIKNDSSDKQDKAKYEFCEAICEHQCSGEIESNQWKQVDFYLIVHYTTHRTL